ncbi:CAP domain-containing protein [Acinetobacter ursingii]|uniref:CAP domain-containing protein n=1 Tax=Acinetobacter ursingii TaxID=108980 RepID=UPI0021E30888|nr:CAP domain-containing protein [Acinetobacter ursingii]UYF81038.1 CAP domain-containing protein [Acinetobacter ursingii]
MKRSKTLMASIRTSTLILAISMAMVGCGGGESGGNTGSNSGGTDGANDGGNSPQPVTCSKTQYLQEGICKNKTAQRFEPLQIHRFLKGQTYQLNLKTDQDLTVNFSSESPNICDFEQGELKVLDVGKCSLKLTQAGTSQLLPVNSTMLVDVIETHAEEHKDLNACQVGRPSEAERQLFINTLNEIRALHHLPKVRYDQSYEDQMMQASMLLAVNEKTSHYPDRTWRCFSDIGYQGASTSNLNFVQAYQPLASYGADTHLINWLIEKNSASIGHRRHILSPFLSKTAYGEVSNTEAKSVSTILGAAMKVVYPYASQTLSTTMPKGVIAYPYHAYPKKFFSKTEPLSLSILVNPQSAYANNTVDFSQAKLTVTRRDNQQAQTISNIQYDNISYGLVANNLQFHFSAMQYNVIYDVNVKNVLVDGKAEDYAYWFKVDDQSSEQRSAGESSHDI